MLRAGDDGNNPDYGRLVVVLGSPTRRRFSMTAAVGAQKLSAGTWTTDPVHSSINFSVRHLMVGKIHGRFDQFSGAITITEDGTPSVAADIDVNSVDTGNEQREAHIKAADFFDVAQFPIATFVSTAVRADGDDYVLEGDFTLKGVTRPVTMTLVFNGVNPGMGRGEVAGFDAAVVLSRKDFGVGAELPLDGGGTMVGDKVTITLALEALKQA
jgi:polyisoprenoid-binding protein YceI